MEELTGRPTPFTEILRAAGGPDAFWIDWNGLQIPIIVNDYMAELNAGRNAVGIVDTSGLRKLHITGRDAGKLLDFVLVRSVRELPRGRVAYALLTTEDGRIRDDATVFRLHGEGFLVASASDLLSWMERHRGGCDAVIADASDDWCVLSVFGPQSHALLRAAGIEGLESLKAFNFVRAEIGDLHFRVSRTGFSGGLGYELWIPWRDGEAVCRHLLDSPRGDDARFIGVGALDILRTEAGYLLPGHDFPLAGAGGDADPEEFRSPFDMGLDWLIDFERDDFVGRTRLLEERRAGSLYELFAVELDVDADAGIESLAGTALYAAGGQRVGAMFAGGFSLTLGKYLGLCNVRRGSVSAGEEVAAGDAKWPAVLRRSPLYADPLRTQTPPPGSSP